VKLDLQARLALPDAKAADQLYADLIAAQAGLTDQQSLDWLARLTLILCNHIGDPEVLRQAFQLARRP
jgi:hypothetical protein